MDERRKKRKMEEEEGSGERGMGGWEGLVEAFAGV